MPPRRNRGPAATSDIPGKILDFVSSFAKGEANDYLEVFQGVMAPWLKALALHGVPRFKAMAARGISCEASNERDGQRYACALPGVADCAACGRKSCLHHAFITWKGDALCWHCASHTVVQMSMNPPQRPEAEGGWRRPNVPPPGGHGVPPQDEKRRQVELEVIRCLQLLGLPRSATASDLEAAFKSYVKRNHPDKVQDPRERELAEQQFKQVSAAYTFLKGVGFGQEARAS